MTDHPTPTSDSSPAPVTVIGLGLMGRALAEAFLANGHPTTVWNRSAAKAAALVTHGATLATSARDAVAASPLVIVCVTDDRAVRDVLDPLGDVLTGRVVVNFTSGTSRHAHETGERATRWGAAYLDGVISADPQAIGTGDALLLYSGPHDAFATHESTLQRLGTATHLGEDDGLASRYEMATLSLMWSVLNGFLHGAALLGAAQVDARSFAAFASPGLTMMAGWLTAMAEQIDAGVYPADDSTIDIHRAAMAHLVDESASLGVDVELPRQFRALADRAVAAGRGGDSYAAMIEQFRMPTGARR
jgi:3-hydroxyisobutyrate dehydrogenase-like beta-hydroxyacid dehydrogenase